MSNKLVVPLVALLLGSCAFGVDDIDRTQPNKIRKSVFTGEWYYRQTVLSVPYTTGFTFAGEQNDPTELVRWEIQERFIIAYRSYDMVTGTDLDARRGGEDPPRIPVAIFPVESHFDVQREYNAQTGEQTNVLVENTTDRPWNERAFMRVDWSQNLAANFAFLVQNVMQVPGTHYVQEPGDIDSFLLGKRNGDAWSDVQGEAVAGVTEAEYLDVVHRIFATPQTIAVEDYDGSIIEEPACWYYGNVDCFPAEIKVRSAFLRVDPSNNYQGRHYPDREILRDANGNPIRVSYKDRDSLQPDPNGFVARADYFDKFGYFRTERDTYDRAHGETNSGRTTLINRFNTWKDTPGCINATSPTPYAACTVKPIVYYLSPGFPADMKDAAYETASEWNDAFKEMVRALKYGPDKPLAEVEDVFILKDNSYEEKDGHVTRRGERPGDLRYNMMAWVDEANQAQLLGYGPSTNDPRTGETINGTAFVYGAAVDTLAQRGKEYIELANDPSRFTEFINGDDVSRDVVLRRATDDRARERTERFAREKIQTERVKAVHRAGREALRTDGARVRARLDALKDTPLETRLASDEIVRAMGRAQEPGGFGAGSRERFSPRHWAMGTRRQHERLRRLHLARHRAEPMNHFDTSIIGIAEAYKDHDPATLYQDLRRAIFKSTMEHEVGHTLGLRHNFEGTSDALNYGRSYWELRGENGTALEPLTDAQKNGRMREFQYSSIMDYGSRFMSDIRGLGMYDRAAIAFGYGDLVEVFATPPEENLLEVATLDDILRHWRHYTKLPSIFGGIDAMHTRTLVPHDRIVDQLAGRADWTLWEVPYRFCSDEYDGATGTCATYDEGADAYEIAMGARAMYLEYFPFLSFSRDRRNFNEWDYMDWVLYRSLIPMLTQYQNWVYDSFFYESSWECVRSDTAEDGCDEVEGRRDTAYYKIDDKPYSEADDAGLPGAAATRLLLDTLAEIIAMPEPGSYFVDPLEDALVLYTYDAIDRCPMGANQADCAAAVIPFGTGRYTDSLWDGESGYYFYDRLQMIGSFYDKVLAMETAVTSDTYFVGVDTGSDVARFLIGLNLYFPEEIYKLVGGAAAQDYARISGVACNDDGSYHPPVISTAMPASPCATMGTQRIDPATSFTVELYAIWYGMAFLPMAFDTTFLDRMKIWVAGNGEQITPSDPTKLVTFVNPLNNRTYHALRAPAANDYSPAAQLLDKAQRLADAYNMAPTEDHRWRLESLVTTIEDVRGTYDIYGYFYF